MIFAEYELVHSSDDCESCSDTLLAANSIKALLEAKTYLDNLDACMKNCTNVTTSTSTQHTTLVLKTIHLVSTSRNKKRIKIESPSGDGVGCRQVWEYLLVDQICTTTIIKLQ